MMRCRTTAPASPASVKTMPGWPRGGEGEERRVQSRWHMSATPPPRILSPPPLSPPHALRVVQLGTPPLDDRDAKGVAHAARLDGARAQRREDGALDDCLPRVRDARDAHARAPELLLEPRLHDGRVGEAADEKDGCGLAAGGDGVDVALECGDDLGQHVVEEAQWFRDDQRAVLERHGGAARAVLLAVEVRERRSHHGAVDAVCAGRRRMGGQGSGQSQLTPCGALALPLLLLLILPLCPLLLLVLPLLTELQAEQEVRDADDHGLGGGLGRQAVLGDVLELGHGLDDGGRGGLGVEVQVARPPAPKDARKDGAEG